MTVSTSLLPPMVGSSLPTPTVPDLSVGEQDLVTGLSNKLTSASVHMQLSNSYYEGLQRLYSLGISIPPQLAGVRTVVDWPRICVDPLVQRAVVDGFRLPAATDVDDELMAHWQANNMDAEAPLCFLDSLVYGRGYMVVGAPDAPGDSPIVTVESPLNMTMTWDPRTRKPTAAFQSYQAEGVYRAALYLPNETVYMSREERGQWVVDHRDLHGFGEVTVVRFPNRSRTANREGSSEITPAVRNTTDSACRSLLGMEIAREAYSIPRLWITGASESDFVGSDGTAKTALDMAMTRILALERDENGETPAVGQFAAFDPSVFTRMVDKHGQLMASYTQFPPEWFGNTTQSNPASADAIRSAQDGVNRRARQTNNQWSDPLEDAMRLVWRYANAGAQPPREMQQLETEWAEVHTPTPGATSDAMQKQVAMGSVPPTSDVVLQELGYSAVQRARLAADRQVDAGATVLAELATSLQAKQARTDLSVAHDINPASDKPANPRPGQ